MSRLVVFGCSHTYGEGQIDCLNYISDNGGHCMAKTPSQYAWPAVLARELNIEEVINLGRPGASNRYIANKILDTIIRKDDIIVILWTEFNRTTMYPSPEDAWKAAKNIHPNQKDKMSKMYYKFVHHPYNSFLESVECMNLANYKLKKHRNVFNFKADFNSGKSLDRSIASNILSEYEFPKWNKVVLINQSLHYVDYAADNDHPGIESHKLIAKDMLRIVKVTNND